MLRSVNSLEGFAVGATDGSFGKVRNFYFDDQAWVVRYLVVDTGSWLGGRDVLISPYSLRQPDWAGRVLPVSATKQQIKDSPGVDTDKPVSRQYEKSYLGYYGYPYYWGGTGLWGSGFYPGAYLGERDARDYDGYQGYLGAPSEDDGDPHLRSCNEVKGYHVKASDGEIGHVQGFLVDDSTWWLGHEVLVSPEWIQQVSWADSFVAVSLDRRAIKAAPVYEEGEVVDRDDELGIYSHYGRRPYWKVDPRRASV
jgi:hypothetical protein